MVKKIKNISHLQIMSFNENPNLGVFCRVNENVAFVQKGLTRKVKKKIESVLNVKIVELDIAGSKIIGSLLAVNSYGAVATNFIDEKNIKIIELLLNTIILNDKRIPFTEIGFERVISKDMIEYPGKDENILEMYLKHRLNQ